MAGGENVSRLLPSVVQLDLGEGGGAAPLSPPPHTAKLTLLPANLCPPGTQAQAGTVGDLLSLKRKLLLTKNLEAQSRLGPGPDPPLLQLPLLVEDDLDQVVLGLSPIQKPRAVCVVTPPGEKELPLLGPGRIRLRGEVCACLESRAYRQSLCSSMTLSSSERSMNSSSTSITSPSSATDSSTKWLMIEGKRHLELCLK
jgi:hypothetical protein